MKMNMTQILSAIAVLAIILAFGLQGVYMAPTMPTTMTTTMATPTSAPTTLAPKISKPTTTKAPLYFPDGRPNCRMIVFHPYCRGISA